jgi:BTB/POZ domain
LTTCSFLESSKYSDFTIKSGSFAFQVHKLVVSYCSEFFDKACSSGFKVTLESPPQPTSNDKKEASEAVMTLHDDPILVARMLLYFYTSDYKPDKDKPGLLHKIMSQARSTSIVVDPCEEVPEVILAAQMYGMAEKYAISDLRDLSVKRFLAEIEGTSMSNLLALIDIIYDSTPESDNLLRKWVVWRIQILKKSFDESNTLAMLVHKQPDFAQDLVTKYAARNYVWCPDCKEYVDLVQCRCGWSGLCGYPACMIGSPKGDLTTLVCTICKAGGKLQFDRA